MLKGEKYLKLYSYHYLINGFSVLVTPEQVLMNFCFLLLCGYNYVYLDNCLLVE